MSNKHTVIIHSKFTNFNATNTALNGDQETRSSLEWHVFRDKRHPFEIFLVNVSKLLGKKNSIELLIGLLDLEVCLLERQTKNNLKMRSSLVTALQCKSSLLRDPSSDAYVDLPQISILFSVLLCHRCTLPLFTISFALHWNWVHTSVFVFLNMCLFW